MKQSALRKPLIVLICVSVCIFTALLSLCFVPRAVNNARARSLESALHRFDYGSPNIEVIDSRHICGKLNGNGNGMQYFAAILLKTDDITAQEIESRLAAVRDEYDIVGVQAQSTAELDCKYLEHATLTFDAVLQDGTSYVAVYLMETDDDFRSLLDIRGH